MRILALGDFHGELPEKIIHEAKKSDFLLITGDFKGTTKYTNIISNMSYNELCQKLGQSKANLLLEYEHLTGAGIIRKLDELGTPAVAVTGNWDPERQIVYPGLALPSYPELIKKTRNITYLDREIREIEGLRIYGFGGMVTATEYATNPNLFGEEQQKRYNIGHERERRELFKNPDNNLDILLAHYPARGYMDIVPKPGNPMDGRHVGFMPYTEYIGQFSPKLFIFGHMHGPQKTSKVKDTTLAKVGPVMRGLYAIIDYDEKSHKVNEIELLDVSN